MAPNPGLLIAVEEARMLVAGLGAPRKQATKVWKSEWSFLRVASEGNFKQYWQVHSTTATIYNAHKYCRMIYTT
jgi:hypothetical protein